MHTRALVMKKFLMVLFFSSKLKSFATLICLSIHLCSNSPKYTLHALKLIYALQVYNSMFHVENALHMTNGSYIRDKQKYPKSLWSMHWNFLKYTLTVPLLYKFSIKLGLNFYDTVIKKHYFKAVQENKFLLTGRPRSWHYGALGLQIFLETPFPKNTMIN